MKREIKFRAWDGIQMWYPETKTVDDNYTCLRFFNHPDSIRWGVYDYLHENRLCSGEYHELMQFTGLLDKNGKEIYEGDIVAVDNDENPVITKCDFYIGQFHLVDNSGGYWTRQLYHQPERLEVIGNIFETPNLLNP